MNLKKFMALALALVMLLSLAACGGGNNTTGSTDNGGENENTSGTKSTVTYSVAVVDALGNPHTNNVVVLFFQNGEQVAMQPVNEEGVATKELDPGEYTVELMSTDGSSLHYNAENLTVSESAPQLSIEMAKAFSGRTEYLFADETDHDAPLMNTGCTYVTLQTGMRNYFVFVPVQSGIYEFTVHHADAAIGYYGSPFYVYSENTGVVTGEHSITIEVKDGMIGTEGAGTAQLVIGVDPGEGVTDCVLSIVRISDYERTPGELPWTAYEPTFTPGKYTLPQGAELKEFDLTASYNLVFNETDGYYHLNSADGPVVLVRLDAALAYGGSLGAILANSNVGVYFYDEAGNFLRKELYNDCLLQYLGTLNKGMGTYSYTGGMMDDNYGVYPLTQDLAYIIQSYGQFMGWWTVGAGNYLFASVTGLNTESAWLFMCCYAE